MITSTRGTVLIILITSCWCHSGFRYIRCVLFQVRDEDEPVSVPLCAMPRTACHPHKSHVIVGGLGGFGLELTQWLVDRGAKYVVLTSRVGVRTGYEARRVRQWREAGVTVTVSTAHVADVDETRTLLRDAAAVCPAGVGGVFNLAAVLHDRLTANQTAVDWARASQPTVSLFR